MQDHSAIPPSQSGESTNVDLSFHAQSDNSGSLYYLKCLLWSLGISADKQIEPKWMVYVNYVVLGILWCIFIVLVEYAVYKISQDSQHDIEYVYVAILTWILNACTVYSIVSFEMNWGRNIIVSITDLASERTSFEGILGATNNSRGSAIEQTEHKSELYSMCNMWIITALFCGFFNMVNYHAVNGNDSFVGTFLPTTEYRIGYVLLPILILCHIVIGIPIIVVRLSSYLTEKRIVVLIEYLEKIRFETHDVVAVMMWYDDLYELNKKFSRGVNQFVTCSLVIGLPNLITLVQSLVAGSGLINRDHVYMVYSWIFTSLFYVAVVTASVARVESLNRRFEIALGNAVSSEQFQSFENAISYDLAMAKARVLPFGVQLFGTRSRISFAAIFKIFSLVISVFLFILGYNF